MNVHRRWVILSSGFTKTQGRAPHPVANRVGETSKSGLTGTTSSTIKIIYCTLVISSTSSAENNDIYLTLHCIIFHCDVDLQNKKLWSLLVQQWLLYIMTSQHCVSLWRCVTFVYKKVTICFFFRTKYLACRFEGHLKFLFSQKVSNAIKVFSSGWQKYEITEQKPPQN